MSDSTLTCSLPAVTVLMAVFNGEPFVAEAVQSVLDQTFKDFELLIINDASTDRTRQIVQGFAVRDRRIRIVDNNSNIGLTRSLNKGLTLAGSEYIARLDADDIAEPDRLRLQIEFLKSHPACSVLATTSRLVNENCEVLGTTTHFTGSELTAVLMFINCVIHSSVMYRRDAIHALGGYDESLDRAQDYDLWLRGLAAGLHFDMLAEPLTMHRDHGLRVTATCADRMEECRQVALQRGWSQLLDVSVSRVELGEHLKALNDPARSHFLALSRNARRLRHLRKSFSKKFFRDPAAIRMVDCFIQKILDNTSPARIMQDLDLFREYTSGRVSYVRVLGQLMGRTIGRRFLRLRIHAGRIRRRLL